MNDALERIILVDAEDREVGLADKLDAHKRGERHRAISVCVSDDRGRMLLQRRALEKYHSGGLWTNACCTHPRPGETAAEAASRRLEEELGVVCPLQFLFVTHYRANVGDGLVEDEMVHLFNGLYEGAVRPDSSEVLEYAWFTPEFLLADVADRPQIYTYWFRQYVFRHFDAIFAPGALVKKP